MFTLLFAMVLVALYFMYEVFWFAYGYCWILDVRLWVKCVWKHVLDISVE